MCQFCVMCIGFFHMWENFCTSMVTIDLPNLFMPTLNNLLRIWLQSANVLFIGMHVLQSCFVHLMYGRLLKYIIYCIAQL